jgi:hypothetical protein
MPPSVVVVEAMVIVVVVVVVGAMVVDVVGSPSEHTSIPLNFRLVTSGAGRESKPI